VATMEISLFATESIPALGRTQIPSQWVVGNTYLLTYYSIVQDIL